MAKRKAVQQVEFKPNQQWMMTFADLLSLVLTFFVLIFSMSTIKMKVWEDVTKSLSQRLDPEREVEFTPPAVELTTPQERIVIAQDLDYLHTILEEQMKTFPHPDMVKMQRLDDRVVISLAGGAAFQKGSINTTRRAEQGLVFLSDILSNIGNRIDVHGNADPEPINTAAYPSNWALSLARAMTVARELQEKGYVYRIRSYGRGASHASTITTRIDDDERFALGRRVDIIIRSGVGEAR